MGPTEGGGGLHVLISPSSEIVICPVLFPLLRGSWNG